MVAEPLVVEFRETNRARVVEHMRAMARAGTGWINFTPGLDVDVAPPPRSGLATLLGNRGPDIPLATWAPARGRDPSTIGIHHAAGPRVVAQLDDQGIPVLETWRVLQDHPKRGLVCAVPSAAPPGEVSADLDVVLEWLLRATGALCPLPRTGEWRALCYGTA